MAKVKWTYPRFTYGILLVIAAVPYLVPTGVRREE